MNEFTKVITLSLESEAQAEYAGLIHLLPLGDFKSQDGRPSSKKMGFDVWQASRDLLNNLANELNAKPAKSFVIDYEHQTNKTEVNGKPAPAAGWAYNFFVNEKGLFAKVEWTARAKEFIKNKEYKFTSPTFYTNKKGEVVKLVSAALTNLPGLEVLQEVLKQDLEPKDEFKIETPTKEDLKMSDEKENVAKQAGIEAAKQKAELDQQFEQLKQQKAELAADSAIAKGLLVPAQRELAIQLARADLEGFNSFSLTLKTPEFLQMQTQESRQTDGENSETDKTDYTATQLRAAKMLGVSVEELMQEK